MYALNLPMFKDLRYILGHNRAITLIIRIIIVTHDYPVSALSLYFPIHLGLVVFCSDFH